MYVNDERSSAGLRDSSEYWDTFAERVTAQVLANRRRTDTLAAFAASARGWIAATALAGVAALLFIMLRQETMPDLPGSIEPSDDMGRQISGGLHPPDVGTLLLEAASIGGAR
jgi:hypothetical protein